VAVFSIRYYFVKN